MIELNKILLADCMDIMAKMPDNYIDLAVVDPPYGIGNFCPQNLPKQGKNISSPVTWNDTIPDKIYFDELKRISKNQIIWGANYYNCFNNLGGALVWHKGKINPVFSQCEIASISFQKRVDYVHINWQAGFARKKEGETIHPCQKPIQLYRWILQNYAKPNDLIFDSHSGSGSLACACHLEKFDFIACEKDKDYHKDSVKRLDELRSQGVLF